MCVAIMKFVSLLYMFQNILNACQQNSCAITDTVCHMTTTVMVMMTVEMGVTRRTAMASVMLQHRWLSPVMEIDPSTVIDCNMRVQPKN